MGGGGVWFVAFVFCGFFLEFVSGIAVVSMQCELVGGKGFAVQQWLEFIEVWAMCCWSWFHVWSVYTKSFLSNLSCLTVYPNPIIFSKTYFFHIPSFSFSRFFLHTHSAGHAENSLDINTCSEIHMHICPL